MKLASLFFGRVPVPPVHVDTFTRVPNKSALFIFLLLLGYRGYRKLKIKGMALMCTHNEM